MKLPTSLSDIVIPPWLNWAAFILALVLSYGLGRLQEARHDGAVHEVAAQKQAEKIVTVVQHEVQTVTKVETVYRDRIQKVYVQEKQIADATPLYVTPDADRRLPLPAGFVRVLDAAWSGTAPGPAAESDAEPASVPPSVVAANEVSNVASCRVWREQALGWRAFYAEQQLNLNGKVGSWYKPENDDAGPVANVRPEN